jgi:hypothetical protein
MSEPSASAGDIECSECRQVFPKDQIIRFGNGYVCAACKPLAIQKLTEGVLDDSSDSEQVRKVHIKHETVVKSVAILYFLTAAILLFGTFGGFSAKYSLTGAAAVLVVVLAACFVIAGLGLRKLYPWARIVSIVLSCLGLLLCGIGTAINAYVLYALLGKEGEIIFSPEYRRVIAETPHVRYRISALIWIVVGLLAFGVAALIWLLRG